MKKIIVAVICLSIMFKVPSVAENAKELNLASESYMLMEADTGKCILSKNEDKQLSPASITKIMTVLLIFESLEKGRMKLEDQVVTSAYAKSMGGSQVFLEEGEEQNVETLLKCILIASGNDASVAMAEKIAGSQEAFVKMMNDKAKELGMDHTHFEDCCGLTDSDNHYTTAKDVAMMSRALITKYPKVLDYSSIWMETMVHKTNKGEKEFVLSNTNKLLKTNQYVKGLKTGSTGKAKYCVSNVAVKDGVRLISVIMAAPDYKIRFAESESLLNYGFSQCRIYADDEETIKLKTVSGIRDVVLAKKEKVSYVDTEGIDFNQIIKKRQSRKYVPTPIKKGDILGYVEYTANGRKIASANIVAQENVPKADYMYELKHLFGLFFQVC